MSKILCIVDSPNWALANRARSLKGHLSGHSFCIKHFNDLDKVKFESFDIVYSLNWPIHGYIQKKISRKRNYRLITTVSSHIGRPPARRMKTLFDNYDAISVSNIFLFKEFNPHYSNVFYTPFGVESKVFKPKNSPSKFRNTFGWAGHKGRGVKRFNDIKTLFDRLGKDYNLEIADGSLNRREMNNFYNRIGTLICFSKSEGTPNPILEAASCGRSIISTSVGNVPQLISGTKTIKTARNIKELELLIRRNSNNGELLDKEGSFLRNKIVNEWCWSIRCKAFIPFLESSDG